MSGFDFLYILKWWSILFLLGLVFLPLTSGIFSNFWDRGYIFSKILGLLLVSYLIWFLGNLKIIPFTQLSIILIIIIFFIFNILLISRLNILVFLKNPWKIFSAKGGSALGWLFEELLFFVALTFWSYIRAHEPSIHGLEKFMDFGFINSILRADYFPPRDMWLSPFPINYYYFGHLVTAVLTKLSGIDPTTTYNLMIATLFALTFVGVFSIGATLIYFKLKTQNSKLLIGGLSSGFLVALAGNLHTIYTFFKPYLPAENPLPFWQLPLSLGAFPNNYWYPNATRFIPLTIHEFPIYSFVVSDLHGHVLNIPFVLLTLAFLLNLLISRSLNIFKIFLLSLLIAVMYMTNVWDGLIYAGLTTLVFIYLAYHSKNYTLYAICYMLIIVGSILFTLPFSLNFKPFVSGIGVLCAPQFLINIGKLGPFLFEPDHCQRSSLWQLLTLYGFFYFWVIAFIIGVFRKLNARRSKLDASEVFILLLIFLATLLIIIPEFVYAKDIYPAHYRANTMFKLGYQAFIMLGIASGYTIARLISNFKFIVLAPIAIGVGSIGLFLVSIYPYFAITSYYGNLKTYRGLDGFAYLREFYPTDYQAILWLKKEIRGQPVILEAQGDSYSDFARVSANTGLPTVIGWPVHEWLWRGSYDVAAPRITDVQTLYETPDSALTWQLLGKYNVELVFVGNLERQKYPSLNEFKFQQLGRIIYQNGQTRIYKITP